MTKPNNIQSTQSHDATHQKAALKDLFFIQEFVKNHWTTLLDGVNALAEDTEESINCAEFDKDEEAKKRAESVLSQIRALHKELPALSKAIFPKNGV